jgi:glycosyltransferase involved in cell wall biosynthesis
MYPEMDFWDAYGPVSRRFRHLKDRFRRRALQRAPQVIFENGDLAARAIRHLGLDPARVHVVRAAPADAVRPGIGHADTAARCSRLPPGFRVLLLSGLQINKNFSLLPRIAEALARDHGVRDVVFITTLPRGHPGTRAYLADAAGRGVGDMIFNFGPVAYAGCAELYSHVDAVILPSRLESFSNTIAEAWVMGRPLLISDLDWARDLCGDGALYIRYDDARDAAGKILRLKGDPDHRAAVVAAGRRVLATYPTSEERFRAYLAIIEAAVASIPS